MTLWIAGIALGLGLIGFVVLQIALSRNAVAVLDTVDKLAGRNSDAAQATAPVAYGDDPAQRLFIYTPPGDGPVGLPVAIFVHGGSWQSGSPVDYGFVARNLVPEGMIVVNAGYRLGPDGKYPGMVEDAASAIAWVHANIASYGGNPEALTIIGHSAGAYNVMMAALDPHWLAEAGVPQSAIRGVVGLAGPYDFLPFTTEGAIAALGHVEPPSATQPVTYIRGDAPPLLLLHGEKDTTVLPRNSRILAVAIRQAGGEAEAVFYPELDHRGVVTALANPWRRRLDLFDRVSQFVIEGSATSVPVQAENRYTRR